MDRVWVPLVNLVLALPASDLWRVMRGVKSLIWAALFVFTGGVSYIYTLFVVSGHATTASLWLSGVIVCVFIAGSIVGFKLAMEASRLVEDYGVDPSAPCTAHTLHSPFTARTLHPPFTVRTRHSPCTTHTLHSLWRPHPRARTARGAHASQTPCNPCLHTHRHTSARSRRPA